MSDHVDVSPRRAIGPRKRVRIERPPDLRPGFPGDLIYEARVGDILQKDCRKFVFFDLRDDLPDIASGNRRFGRDARRRSQLDTVGLPEIAESVVRRDDPATIGRNFRHGRAHVGVERIELFEIGPGARRVVSFARGIGRDQSVADIGHVDFGVRDILPGMRVSPAMRMIMVAMLFAGGDACARHHDPRLRRGGLGEPADPSLEIETVLDDQPRGGELATVGGRRRVGVNVAIGADEGGNLDPFAADLADEVGEDGEGRDDEKPGGLSARQSCSERNRAPGKQEPTSIEHLYASRCRRFGLPRRAPPARPNTIDTK